MTLLFAICLKSRCCGRGKKKNKVRLCNQSSATAIKCFVKLFVSHSTTSEFHHVDIFCPLQKHFTKKPYRKPIRSVLGSLAFKRVDKYQFDSCNCSLLIQQHLRGVKTCVQIQAGLQLYSAILAASQSYQKGLIYVYSHASCENLLKALGQV